MGVIHAVTLMQRGLFTSSSTASAAVAAAQPGRTTITVHAPQPPSRQTPLAPVSP